MPAEGPVPGAGIGLIETLRWSPQGGYDYRAEHLDRLALSARSLGFEHARVAVERRLADFAAGLDGAARVRLVLSRDGAMTIAATPLGGPAPARYRVAVAGPRHRSGDPRLAHKTTDRDRYERPLAVAAATLGADEVLFLNERDEPCEGARTNLFVRRDGTLLTPHLACGVLPGTLRAHLIATGRAREARLELADLATAPAWFLGNSVRGLVPATLVGDRPARLTP